MKNFIYKFISEYVSYYEIVQKYKFGWKKIADFPENSDIRKMLNEIKVSDPNSYTTILKLDEDEVLYEYLKFVLKYYDKKKSLGMSSSKIVDLTKIPMLAITRFENLQHIASFKMICAIAKSVNLNITWE